MFLYDPPSHPPYKTIWKQRICLKKIFLVHEFFGGLVTNPVTLTPNLVWFKLFLLSSFMSSVCHIAMQGIDCTTWTKRIYASQSVAILLPPSCFLYSTVCFVVDRGDTGQFLRHLNIKKGVSGNVSCPFVILLSWKRGYCWDLFPQKGEDNLFLAQVSSGRRRWRPYI